MPEQVNWDTLDKVAGSDPGCPCTIHKAYPAIRAEVTALEDEHDRAEAAERRVRELEIALSRYAGPFQLTGNSGGQP